MDNYLVGYNVDGYFVDIHLGQHATNTAHNIKCASSNYFSDVMIKFENKSIVY